MDGKDATVGITNNIGKAAKSDAELVRALKQLGAVPFVRTNLPQTCIRYSIFLILLNPKVKTA